MWFAFGKVPSGRFEMEWADVSRGQEMLSSRNLFEHFLLHWIWERLICWHGQPGKEVSESKPGPGAAKKVQCSVLSHGERCEEEEANTDHWRQVYTLPIPRWVLTDGKLLVTQRCFPYKS